MIKIVVSGQPVAKGRVRFAKKTGHTFTPERTVNYETKLALAAQAVMDGRPPLEGALRVEVLAEMQIPQSWSKKKRIMALERRVLPVGRPDLDNFAKILDALNLVCWIDDSQIVDMRVRKLYSAQPQFTIGIETLDSFFA